MPVENQCLRDNEFTFRYDGTSPVMSYSWDFGEPGATSNFPIPRYTYQTHGLKIITLTVTDDLGCEGSANIALEVYPEVFADFSFEPACGRSPLQITDASAFDPSVRLSVGSGNFNNSNSSRSESGYSI
ncbi:MAG: PKD domain-containing protein [Bacteroidia bacterium]